MVYCVGCDDCLGGEWEGKALVVGVSWIVECVFFDRDYGSRPVVFSRGQRDLGGWIGF